MHKVTLKTYVVSGLIISSITYALWPVLLGITGFYSVVLLVICQCVNGFFQATAWPGMVGLFSRFFTKNKKGLLLGIWSMNANVGNLIAEGLLNVMRDNQVYWIWNFVLTGGMCIIVAVLMIVLMRDFPK